MSRLGIRKETIRTGAKFFILFTVLGILAVYFWGERKSGFLSLRGLHFQFIGVVILLTALDYFLGASRIWFIARSAGKSIRFPDAIRADFCNTFFSAVTPMQTGGGPAQLFILTKVGLRFGEALAVSSMNFFFSVIFIYCAAGFVAFTGIGEIKATVFLNLFRFAYVFVIFFVITGLLNIRYPAIAFWFIDKFKKMAHFFFPGHAGRIEGIFQSLIEHLRIWWSNFLYLLREKKLYLVVGLILTAVLFTNKYTMAYFIIRGLGIHPGYVDVISTMLLLNALLYFSPSPGASGIAEVAAASLVGGLLPGGYAMVFTVIWRFFSSYLGVTLGAIILYRAIADSLDSSLIDEDRVVSDPVGS